MRKGKRVRTGGGRFLEQPRVIREAGQGIADQNSFPSLLPRDAPMSNSESPAV